MPLPQKFHEEKVMTIKEKIYNRLSQWIMDGTLAPDEKINESEIAAYFSVSRTPVREALQLLSEQRLVKILPNKGSFVSSLKKEDAQELYEALAAINGYIAILACEKRTDDDIRVLKKLSDDFSAGVKRNLIKKLPELYKNFHLYIAFIANNNYLKEYLTQLTVHAYRYEYYYFNQSTDRSDSIKGHEDLIDAIIQRDKTTAHAIAEKNWTHTLQILSHT